VFECLDGAESSQGLNLRNGTSNRVVSALLYNNTFFNKSGGECENTIDVNEAGTNLTLDLRNNIIYSTTANSPYNAPPGSITRDYNNWFGDNAPSCIGNELCEDPQFNNAVVGDYSLADASNLIGAGVAITNIGMHTFDKGPVPLATWPNPILGDRTTPWDIGAFVETAAGGDPPPPDPPVTGFDRIRRIFR
jgi:hypothetical protein